MLLSNSIYSSLSLFEILNKIEPIFTRIQKYKNVIQTSPGVFLKDIETYMGYEQMGLGRVLTYHTLHTFHIFHKRFVSRESKACVQNNKG